MTYYESAKNVTITKERAIKEVLNHGCSPDDFIADCGDCEKYNAQSVLNWLGY